MLKAFSAEPIVELRQRDKSKIESLLAHGDQLLAGLSTGALRVYRVPEQHSSDDSASDNENSTTTNTELLREYENFSKYKIDQLATFKEANILISLSGNFVSIHDLGNFQLQEQLLKTKGASTFAVTSNIVNDLATGVPSLVSRLAVAVKRRIILWSWHDGELAGDAQDIALATSIKTLTWATGTTIVAGLQSHYCLVDIDSEEVETIQGPGSIGGGQEQETSRLGGIGTGTMNYIGMGSMVPPPLVTGLGEHEMLLARDINSLFMDRSGEPIKRRQVPWKSSPHAVAYSYPFLLSLHEPAKARLEVRNPQTLSVLQSIDLPGATSLQVPNPNISLAHQGKGFLVASDRVVWRMKGLNYDAQIEFLIESGLLDEAISLLGMIEATLVKDKSERLREIKMQKAQRLFDEMKFREALDLFGEVSAPPHRVISLYPERISGELAMPENTPGDPAKSHQKSGSVASMKGSKEDDSASVHSPRAMRQGLSDKELKAAVRELQAFLADVRRRLQRFFDSDQSVKDLVDIRQNAPQKDVDSVIHDILELQDDANPTIGEKLLGVATLVDTTLFRAHMFATPSLAGSLFRISNFCDPEVVMTKLEAAERYNDLIEFLYGKRLHREALERLQKFGQAEGAEAVNTGLRGPERSVAYMQNLPADFVDLILEFASWPLTTNPDLGMEIFLADTANAESLPRDQVTKFLELQDKSLALRYLEHIIHELNDSTPELHHHLAILYFDRIENASPKEEVELFGKFLSFLQESSQYSAAKILNLLPRDDPRFYEATAIVLSKMGQHKQALQIYVFKLHDTIKAEEYCNTVHVDEIAKLERATKTRKKPKAPDLVDNQSSIYHTLLNLYLNPPNNQQPMIAPAIELMGRHGPRLPASSTLELIPNDLLVKELEFYFRGRVRNVNTAVNDARIISGLRKVDSVRLQTALLLGDTNSGIRINGGKQRKVRVDDERICGVCHKRLGNSVISVFPDNSVVHLGCAPRRQNELVGQQ